MKIQVMSPVVKKPIRFVDLPIGQVFTMAQNQAGRLLMKVRYTGGLGLSPIDQFGNTREIAIYLHSGFTHMVDGLSEVVPVDGIFTVNPNDITPAMFRKYETKN